MKNRNNVKRILCTVLCLCMVVGSLLVLSSCNNEETPSEKTGEVVSVVKVAKEIAEGTKITADMIEVIETKVSNVPLNAIRDKAKVEGKYATQKLYVGEYVFAGKLTDTDRSQFADESGASHLVVTDQIEVNGDITDKLQKLIDDNPGRTIDFPDGEYIVSKSIKIPTDPAKAVSLRLADFAIIKAADNWTGDDAVLCLSVGDMPQGSELSNTFYLTGGTIDANGKTKGISIGNAENLLISNVGIKNATVGIEAKAGVLDVENVNIVGNSDDSAVGMIVGSKNSTYTNVRISKVATGVKVTGDNNLLKSVYATYTGTSKDSVAFVDSSNGCNYDMCTSEQFATGFSLETNTVSVYSGCYAKWNDNTVAQNWAFKAVGKFNGVVRACRADFDNANCDGTFLEVATEGGKGQILYPMIGGEANMTDKAFEAYLCDTKVVYRSEPEEDLPQ